MNFHFITLFPEPIQKYFDVGVVGRALQQGNISVDYFSPREYSNLPHRQVDDRPYGGGSGMVMRADILELTLRAAFEKHQLKLGKLDESGVAVIVTAASGKQYTQKEAMAMKEYRHVFLICGRYEGIDQRFIDQYATHVFSAGPYVLSGGELPALMMADSMIRLIPGVLGNEQSLLEESFGADELLEYPHYTRPEVFNQVAVPTELLSGNHQAIADWRKKQRHS